MNHRDNTHFPILVIGFDKESMSKPGAEEVRKIGQLLKDSYGYSILHETTLKPGLLTKEAESTLGCIVIDADLCGDEQDGLHYISMIEEIRRHNTGVPIILAAERAVMTDLPIGILGEVREYVHLGQDTSTFIAGRVDFAVKQYMDSLLPPYFKALKSYAEDRPYYWDCPGHQGGVAYLKHPVGREFLRFFGENIMRADIGIATPDLGNWLEHRGVPGQSEREAARTFGADATYYVVGGSSQSNQIVGHAMLRPGEMVLVDRNCHKSVNHELTITGARPIYFKPARNGYGLIGLIPPEQFEAAAIRDEIATSPMHEGARGKAPVYAVVTNSTYDGLIYDVDRITRQLAGAVPRIKFDEAWYAYAKFHPLYAGRYAMGVPEDLPERPTLIAVQSTHKMLAAFSSASMIHIRNSERAPIDHDVFNQSFMMHGTTSPFYPIIASIDVATSMMKGESGKALLRDAINDAVDFRKTMLTMAAKLGKSGDHGWWFGVWQPDEVQVDGKRVPFLDVPNATLERDPTCWWLRANEAWHGFGEIEDGYAMLDPIKVTITCPGIDALGRETDFGIPAPVVSRFLGTRRTIPARNGDYNLLILYALGSTQGKWGTLIESLLEFKRLHDTDASLATALPELVALAPRYRDMTLRELCAAIHRTKRELKMTQLSDAACTAKASPVMSPSEAYQRLISDGTEKVRVRDMVGRTVGVMVTPYPPGIPVIMPGERVAPDAHAIVDYLLAMERFSRLFPGFESELQGVEVDDEGNYWVRCLKQ
ncbi:Orn/Lys/Arg decarboxylase N-terminal domain-containing protein [Burkholderia plantarii]|uniref:Orn/Lys/Arg family decarboxylase n=1 Tax=Burkholderia plantarii TaxID=41899 RepID=UPI0006D898FE|nr:Orn/Lys/Arg decarboxylase N-terminal domain-containing protein [Burkholderia plantarii]ALK29680.1 Lysine decarboxylase [Burkholderia plantarii]GLZ20173.1 arginine decarboxylase [Burkholderia plantarii]